MSRRSIATAFAVAIVASVVAFAHAGPADYLMPVDKHTTPKGRALAAKYRPQLLELSDYVYHCLPYLEIRNGLGFKRVPKETVDNRYAAVWRRAGWRPSKASTPTPTCTATPCRWSGSSPAATRTGPPWRSFPCSRTRRAPRPS